MSTFAGALSARAMDPVLPQVAADLAVTIQVAAMVASAFAVTFALVQPATRHSGRCLRQGEADLHLPDPSGRIEHCGRVLDLLRHAAGDARSVGSGRRWGHARHAGARRRSLPDPRTASCAEPDPRRRDGGKSSGRYALRPDWRHRRLARGADHDRRPRARGFRGRRLGFPASNARAAAANQLCRHGAELSRHPHAPACARLLPRRLHRGQLPAWPVSVRGRVSRRARRAAPVDRRSRDGGLSARRAGLHQHGIAAAAADRRKGTADWRRRADGVATRGLRARSTLAGAACMFRRRSAAAST